MLPTAIAADETRVTLNVTETHTLTYTLTPSEAVSNVTFRSSSSSVVKVDPATGELTALRKGTATVTMTTTNGKTASTIVVVTDTNPASAISLGATKKYTMFIGDTLPLTASLTPDTAVTFVTWSTSSSKIASVDQEGLVTAVAVGSATIRVATSNGKYATVAVSVFDPYVPASVAIDGENTIYVALGDQSVRLTAVVTPSTASQDVTWSVSNTRYAKVSLEGYITPVREGTVTVTAKTANRKTDKVTVVVYDPLKPVYVTMSATGTADLALTDTLQLSAEVFPSTADASLSALTWSSSSTRYATVDNDGLVTPKKVGTVTIKASTRTGKYSTVKVRIYDPRIPMKVTLDHTGTEKLDLYDPDFTVTPEVYPLTAADDTTFLYSSSRTSVAVVNAEGLVSLRGPGTATITVRTKNPYTKGNVSASFKVTVIDHNAPGAISIDQGTTLSMDLYDTQTLSYTLSAPSSASYEPRAHVTWTSSSAVVKVSESGEVTPQRAGRAVVTATTHNGKRDTITVTVTDVHAPRSVRFEQTSQTVYLDTGVVSLTPVLYPEDAMAKYTWSTSDRTIATVNGEGSVTLLKEGTVTIRALTHNGLTASIKLYVYDPTLPANVAVINANTGEKTGTALMWDHSEGRDGALKLALTMTAMGGESYTPNPGKITWASSTPSVARINADGEVTWYKNGAARFVGTTERGKKTAFVIVTFYTYVPVTEIKISASTLSMFVGTTQTLSRSCLPAGSLAGAKLTWSSSDESIISVDENGKLTAKGAGYVTISCTDTETGISSNDLNLTSSYPPTYRALVLAHPSEKSVVRTSNNREYNVTWRRTTDVDSMKRLLGLQTYGGKKFSISTNANASRADALNAIANMAALSHEDDVTVISILTEGSDNGTVWFGSEGITPSDLANALSAINGRVVVLMANDYSGYYITEGSGENGEKVSVAANDPLATGKGFNSSFISAFRAAQTTVPVYPLDKDGNRILPPEPTVNSDGSVTSANYGELREDKFYVLTASTAFEETYFLANITLNSWNDTSMTATMNESATYDYFVRGLCLAGGYNPATHGTSWSGRAVTLQQAYSSTASYVKTHESSSAATGHKYSTVMVYPAASSFVLFQH